MNRKRIVGLILIGIVFLGAVAGTLLWLRAKAESKEWLTFYGNVDIREIQLAFYDEGRIERMLVQEGDRVRKGQILAELDISRLDDAVRKAEATVRVDQAALENADITFRRTEALAKDLYVSLQDRDNAVAVLKEARDRLKADEAALVLARRQLHDGKLVAPKEGVIEVRILEPGDMVTPQAPVFTVALDNPVWARIYVPEPDLGKIFPGMRAEIYTDSYPGRAFPGWIGYISPTAEFTPKNVETPQLRTRLVYEVRVYACNPDYRLRLGMPATVKIRRNQPYPPPPPPCTVE
ncbi:efflux RND transporter periplasmic adaptor subunit [Verrucomicrobium sp. 3C]|uniref:efflux RND transporter periplasmic adaptor subunit n=1 Tax=Verrucomicrobium sp. 3C TaxID=1134055 RepID=UPI000593B2FF|nr:efflux RND transporter periplasmic adaptor subunit [Verrucomicrobium sp. 3C]